MPVSIHQGRTPPLLCKVVDIDTRLPRTHFLSSKRQFILALPGRQLWISFFSSRPSYLKRTPSLPSGVLLQGTMIVNLCEVSQPLRETLPAHLTEVRHDVLYEAVSILLLVRQQLQRIDQIPTSALRYCMRFEDLGQVNTFACLHHQEPVWFPPSIFFSTDRTLPMCVLFTPETHQTWSSIGKLLQCGHKYDIVTPPCPLLARQCAASNLYFLS